MRKYLVTLQTTLNVSVKVKAENEEDAADIAWERAEEFAGTLDAGSKPPGVFAEASFDGIGADEVTER